jgi:hypothetical protein
MMRLPRPRPWWRGQHAYVGHLEEAASVTDETAQADGLAPVVEHDRVQGVGEAAFGGLA